MKDEFWVIRHPGKMHWVLCHSFEEAETLFEGFNLPIKLKPESLEESRKRIDDFF